jgi:hypothetical protein
MSGKDEDLSKNEFFIAHYNSLREEILQRLKEHNQLYWIKIIAVGAILSVFFGLITGFEWIKEGFLSYLIWLVPLISIAFDFQILGNMTSILEIGKYTKFFIETKVQTELKNSNIDFTFWESIRAKFDWKFGPNKKAIGFLYFLAKGDLVIFWFLTLVAIGITLGIRINFGFSLAIDLPILILILLLTTIVAIQFFIIAKLLNYEPTTP